MFVLQKLTDRDIEQIIRQAVNRVAPPEWASSSESEPSSSPSTFTQSSQTVVNGQDDSLYPTLPQLTSKIIFSIASLASGDARIALSLLELVLLAPSTSDESTLLSSLKDSVSTSYDRTGESRYDMISALHKSVRGSQGSAAMYWLARMLAGGEDPLYIVRRMIVCASEDIGLADNHALPLVSSRAHPGIHTNESVRPSPLCMPARRLGCQSVGSILRT